VALAVMGITISCQDLRRQRVPVILWHRIPSTESGWDIRWLSIRRTNPIFCVFPVFSVADR
jgi:hypothetical protein